MWNRHSRSFILQSITGISPSNIAGLISDVSKEVATQIAKNCRRRQPHCYLTPPPRGTPVNIRIPHTPYTGISENYNHWATFLSLIVWVYLHSFRRGCLPKMWTSAQNSVKIWTYSSSRSSKVINFGTNRKRIYDFLLVINSIHGTILHRFWDTAT